jgi:hypothetical protein
MPKNKVSDPITDQEIAFARLGLSGAMTDRHAAEAVGLNPDSAAYTKSKPLVRAYMLEHRAAVEQQLVQREVEGQHRLNLDREQVLNRLWELAKLSPEMTRNSMSGQVKCLAMIAAMQNFIPDRRTVDRLAVFPEKKSATAPAPPQIHTAAWLRRHKATTIDPHPWQARSRPRGRAASGPRPQPVHLRQPLYPGGSPAALCSPIQFCSRPGSPSSYKEPLCPPPLSF